MVPEDSGAQADLSAGYVARLFSFFCFLKKKTRLECGEWIKAEQNLGARRPMRRMFWKLGYEMVGAELGR